MRNYYEILGVSETASQEEIKTAFRRLSKKFHPDKHNNDKEFTELFKMINEAYRNLSSIQKRNQYDQQINRQETNCQYDRTYKWDVSELTIMAACVVVANSNATTSIIGRKLNLTFTDSQQLLDNLLQLEIIEPLNGTSIFLVKLNKWELKQFIRSKTNYESIWRIDSFFEQFEDVLEESSKYKPKKASSSTKTNTFLKVLTGILLVLLFYAIFKDKTYNKYERNLVLYGEIQPTKGLNLRSSASINADIIMTIPYSEKVMIILNNDSVFANSEEWIRVKYKEQTGWVWRDFITIKNK